MSVAAAEARQARDKVAAARVWLMKHKPFFGVLARALRIEPSDEVPALRLLPDDRLQVRPELVAELRMRALCARLAHVSLHAALGAFVRRRGREARRWNVAHDLAIAPLLDAAELHTGGLLGELRELPEGASAEAYYELLDHGTAPAPPWCDLCEPPADDPPPEEQASEGQGEGEDPSAPIERHQELPPEAGVPLPRQQPTLPEPQPNEAQPNEPQPNEPQNGESQSNDAPANEPQNGEAQPNELPEPLSAEDKARALQWQMRLLSALEEEARSGGKTFGDMPGWIEEMVRATVEPPAHWSVMLQRAVSTLQRRGRSYLRPSRRMSALAGASGRWPDTVTMPGRRIESAGRLAVVIDTSASIALSTLARFLGTVASIATAEGVDDVRLLCADATVTSDETLFAAELYFRQVTLTGRGGTDFRAPLHQLQDEAVAAGQRFTVVYLTDLEGRFPDPEAITGLSVLWVVPPSCPHSPPFGELLRLHATHEP